MSFQLDFSHQKFTIKEAKQVQRQPSHLGVKQKYSKYSKAFKLTQYKNTKIILLYVNWT